MSRKLVASIKEQAIPLDDPSAFDRLLKDVGDTQIVMIGEATHGTSDFYRLRAEFSKRLIQKKGFAAIAVEGDWPSVEKINSYVKGYHDQPYLNDLLSNSFSRWPAWMWANEEVEALKIRYQVHTQFGNYSELNGICVCTWHHLRGTTYEKTAHSHLHKRVRCFHEDTVPGPNTNWKQF